MLLSEDNRTGILPGRKEDMTLGCSTVGRVVLYPEDARLQVPLKMVLTTRRHISEDYNCGHELSVSFCVAFCSCIDIKLTDM